MKISKLALVFLLFFASLFMSCNEPEIEHQLAIVYAKEEMPWIRGRVKLMVYFEAQGKLYSCWSDTLYHKVQVGDQLLLTFKNNYLTTVEITQ